MEHLPIKSKVAILGAHQSPNMSATSHGNSHGGLEGHRPPGLAGACSLGTAHTLWQSILGVIIRATYKQTFYKLSNCYRVGAVPNL